MIRGTTADRESSVARLLISATLAAALVQAAAMILSHAYLFADGSFYLYMLLTTEWPLDTQPSRYFADFLTQWPAALAIRLGLTNVDALSYLLGASLYLTPLVSLMCCAWIVRGRRHYLVFPLVSTVAVTANSSFFIVSEGHVLVALFWPLMLLLVLHKTWTTTTVVLAFVLAAPTLRCYESMIFLGPLLALASGWRAWRSTTLPLRFGFVTLTVYFLAGIVEAVRSIQNPVTPQNLKTFLGTFRFWADVSGHWHPMSVLSVIALTLVTAVIVFAFSHGAAWRFILRLFALLCIGAALSAFAYPAFIAPFLHYRARVLNAYLPPLIAVLFLWSIRQRPAVHTWTSALLVIVILAWSQAAWHVAAAREWRGYLDLFRAEVSSREGLVPYVDSRLSETFVEHMNWGWTMPTMSVLLAPGGDVKAIIDNATEVPWQPFFPRDASTWPDLSKYGIRLDSYRARHFALE